MHEGDGLPGFPSVDVFIYLVTPQLEKLRDPALELILFYPESPAEIKTKQKQKTIHPFQKDSYKSSQCYLNSKVHYNP